MGVKESYECPKGISLLEKVLLSEAFQDFHKEKESKLLGKDSRKENIDENMPDPLGYYELHEDDSLSAMFVYFFQEENVNCKHYSTHFQIAWSSHES